MSSRIALAQLFVKVVKDEDERTLNNAFGIATQELERAFGEMEIVARALQSDRELASTYARDLADTLSGAMKSIDVLTAYFGVYSSGILTPNIFSAFTRAETFAERLARGGPPSRYEHEVVDAVRFSLERGRLDLASISFRLTLARDSTRPLVYGLTWRLASLAARLLPPSDRPRYAEEFQSELHELAQISGRAQLTYAARLLARAIPLRHELHRTAHKVAGEQ
ncbi:MAG TPA: hypothetical protein VL551_05485 [Actinospica sp.]|nr:hypothetical protein [Actinospica sp.]